MTKQIERQPTKISPEALPTQKGQLGEKMIVFRGKAAAPALEVINLAPSLRTDRNIHSYPSKNNGPIESNVSCPDASCPSSSCIIPNTNDNAHTCNSC